MWSLKCLETVTIIYLFIYLFINSVGGSFQVLQPIDLLLFFFCPLSPVWTNKNTLWSQRECCKTHKAHAIKVLLQPRGRNERLMAKNEKYRPSFSSTARGQWKVYSPIFVSMSVWNIVFLPVPWSLVVSPVKRLNKSCLYWKQASEHSFIFFSFSLNVFRQRYMGCHPEPNLTAPSVRCMRPSCLYAANNPNRASVDLSNRLRWWFELKQSWPYVDRHGKLSGASLQPNTSIIHLIKQSSSPEPKTECVWR